ncbi:hypothetical protein GH714_015175 [Hevea brasiliensis]|uniref:Nonsense-mediated mRNA decay factor SMG8 n=1 Tax=Hevea brasiliensis TaxID=3981 RepID=A0A6A6LGV8_HEVBR|nr:hypothetical protein GH714_015175 [Hevea brasiliensis]
MDSTNPNPPSMRVLTRPPPPAPMPASSPDAQPSSQSQPRSLEGVVVVGFVSRSPDHSSQLINRVLDSNTFGSGNLDKLLFNDKEEVRDWFNGRRISYYHEEEKGILFLQFCSTRCPAVHGSSGLASGLDSCLEEREFEDLQGLLFMFSANPSTGSSPGRSGVTNRNASAISLMSGLGFYTSLFPGHCTPVILFVFVDDFFEMPNPNSNTEESKDLSLLNQSSGLSSVSRPNLPTKGSGSVVVLARPVSKSEGGFRKKLQSSLEAQIRFLIKKCRTLSGAESGHSGSRSVSVTSSAPLFSLDASRAVVLLDRLINQRGESLEFVTDLVEDVLNGKATSDSLLLETHGQSANKEDILSIKEFIFRQSDILRDETEAVKRKSRQRNSGLTQVEGFAPKGMDPLDVAVSLLESGRGLNAKFSTLWCERTLPTAKDVYLKDLPACYPTSEHEAHLGKALSAFYSMVRDLQCLFLQKGWRMNAPPSGNLVGNYVMLLV